MANEQLIATWRESAAKHRDKAASINGRGVYHERLKSAHHFSAATLEACANDLESESKRTSADVLLRHLDQWANHVRGCTSNDCGVCEAAFNLVIKAHTVWSNSQNSQGALSQQAWVS
jgi:hypothetical protein